MAPIKYEEQMKDKLEKRSLQPSPESWLVLANRLDKEQKNKNKSLFWWIGIAASIVGILFVTTMYFNNLPVENTIPIIVDSEESSIQKKTDEIINNEAHSDEVAVEEMISVEKTYDETDKKSSTTRIYSERNIIKTEVPEQDAVAQVQEDKVQSSVTLNAVEALAQIKNAQQTFEEQKIQEVVAQIKAMNSDDKKVSDTEIENLLKNAQREILSNRLYNETTRTVDASVLLQDVEEDLQQSFRSKVLEALQSGYESVKTAVVQRNN